MNTKIVGYRKMLGMSQEEIAKKFGISKQAYYRKEKGKTAFNDREKQIFKNMLLPMFPDITIDSIFFDYQVNKSK